MIFEKKYTPRWIVFIIDVFISAISITIAYLLRFNFNIPQADFAQLYFVIPFVISVRIISFFCGRTYSGIIRYTGIKDAERIFFVILYGSIFFMLSNTISYYFITGAFIIPISIVIIDFITTVFLMTVLRLIVKTIFSEIFNKKKETKNVIIWGADEYGIITKQTLERDSKTKYNVLGFVDKVKQNTKKKIEGVYIYPYSKLNYLLENNLVSQFIIAKPITNKEIKNNIIEICLKNEVNILTVPDIDSWINGELSSKQIKKFKVEDLLGRETIILDKEKIKEQTDNQTILVTGAAGSIGSEIVRQLIKFNPKKIVLFDQAESPLYDIELEIREKYKFINFDVVIGDITNIERVDNVFETFKPTIVYHAAAYKHVPMMENNPTEAIRVNIFGTKIITDFSIKYNVRTFVMISTDKAVNPTNVMGASKRIAEIYVQSSNKFHKTNFITTRFGNVLGSNGSVIPRFRKQIEMGGPVTVTHPEVTRYFMTIPEACQLVLEASAMGKGGEIFIFDMGKSVKILDLAKRMIQFSGLTLDKDIKIQFSGLRPGEKLYEELLNTKENTIPTYNSQIMIAKNSKYDYDEISIKISNLIGYVETQNNFEVVKLMKEIVPEFISKNSVYEELDKK
ncbi:MAG: polysaccharide biosynthesis protein [Bacteroidetes bacterium]|nr:MAG: polysaccharide biosynthesis protein [Bacteroidota bacterium]